MKQYETNYYNFDTKFCQIEIWESPGGNTATDLGRSKATYITYLPFCCQLS